MFEADLSLSGGNVNSLWISHIHKCSVMFVRTMMAASQHHTLGSFLFNTLNQLHKNQSYVLRIGFKWSSIMTRTYKRRSLSPPSDNLSSILHCFPSSPVGYHHVLGWAEHHSPSTNAYVTFHSLSGPDWCIRFHGEESDEGFLGEVSETHFPLCWRWVCCCGL